MGRRADASEKGRKGERERERENERDDDDDDAPRERLMHTAVARVFSKPSFPRNTPRPRPSSASFDLDRTTDRPFPFPSTLRTPSFRSILFLNFSTCLRTRRHLSLAIICRSMITFDCCKFLNTLGKELLGS